MISGTTSIPCRFNCFFLTKIIAPHCLLGQGPTISHFPSVGGLAFMIFQKTLISPEISFLTPVAEAWYFPLQGKDGHASLSSFSEFGYIVYEYVPFYHNQNIVLLKPNFIYLNYHLRNSAPITLAAGTLTFILILTHFHFNSKLCTITLAEFSFFLLPFTLVACFLSFAYFRLFSFLKVLHALTFLSFFYLI